MFNEKNPEVLIVGAGPVGLFAALDLTRRGVRVKIVDTGVWACKHSYALALHPQSMKLFDEFGMLSRVMENAYAVRNLGLYDRAGCRAVIRLAELGDPAPFLAVLRQDVVEALLEQELLDLGVRVSWKHDVSRLTPGTGSVAATIDRYEKESRGYIVAHTEWVLAKSTTVEAPYVIGADGYNSRVRRALGFDFAEVGPASYYAVFEFQSDADLNHEMRIVLGDRTTDVLWPLPNGQCRWSFQLPDYTDPALEPFQNRELMSEFGDIPSERLKERLRKSEMGHLPVLKESNLQALIAERAPWFNGSIDNVIWRTVVRFEQRQSAAFGCGRLWLAGDSAHLTGPVGVQSMNLGLHEAHELAGSLARILRDGAPTAQLQTYDERWSAQWRRLHGMERALQAAPGADPWVCRHANRLMSCLPAHGSLLDILAGQLALAE